MATDEKKEQVTATSAEKGNFPKDTAVNNNNGADNNHGTNNGREIREETFEWHRFYEFTSTDYSNVPYDYFGELTSKGEYHKLADRVVHPHFLCNQKKRQ